MNPAVIGQLFDNFGPVIMFTIAVFLGFEALLLWLIRRRRVAVGLDDRLRIRDRAERREVTLDDLRRTPQDRLAERSALVRSLRRLILQSGARVSPLHVLLGMVVVGICAWVLSRPFTSQLPLRGLLTMLFGIGLPLGVLAIMRGRRILAFERQLPEAIDVIVRSLRAGHPVPVAVAMVAREMPDPIGSEFAVASSEMTYGLDLESAMVNLRERSGQSDLGFLVVAIGMQAKTGGNLAEVLGNLSKMLRDRSRMRRKIKALSAEGRASAVALSMVPLLLFVFLQFFVPKFYGDVAHEPILVPIGYIAVAVWFVGVCIMYRMVNFRI